MLRFKLVDLYALSKSKIVELPLFHLVRDEPLT